MAKIVTIQGANNTDELERFTAMEKLNELPTQVLTRVASLSQNAKAQKYFSSGILFETVKAFLK